VSDAGVNLKLSIATEPAPPLGALGVDFDAGVGVGDELAFGAP
jgi:hypothetical protein